MNPEIDKALRTAAQEAQALDPDIIGLPVFSEIVNGVTTQADVTKAVSEMKKLKPALFLEQDFAKMTETRFTEREAQFREGLRKPRSFTPTEFHSLDASRLSAEELKALDKCVGGQSNSWDRGLLVKALARQRLEDNVLKGGAA
jgi:hypothetical protein